MRGLPLLGGGPASQWVPACQLITSVHKRLSFEAGRPNHDQQSKAKVEKRSTHQQQQQQQAP